MTCPARKLDRDTSSHGAERPAAMVTPNQADQMQARLMVEGPDPLRHRLPAAEQDDLGIVKGAAQFGDDGLGSTLST